MSRLGTRARTVSGTLNATQNEEAILMNWHQSIRATTSAVVLFIGVLALIQLSSVPAIAGADCGSCFVNCNNFWQACRGGEGCPEECWEGLENCLEVCCAEYGEDCCTELQEC
jgi:hypothetical protein